MKLTKGQLLELDIDSAAYQGVAVGRVDDFVVFVKNAVPGDRVQARVLKKRKSYAEAIVEEVLEASAHRVEPRCKYSGLCGGCSWQDVAYERQLEYKRSQVEEIFQRLGGLDFSEVRPALASPDVFYYRNKMEFTFGTNRWITREEIENSGEVQKGFALGMHLPGRWDKILDLDVCFLQSPLSAEIVNEIRKIALEHQWSAYNTRRNEGYLRNLVIRTGVHTNELMINLVTRKDDSERMSFLKDALLTRFPEITTFVNSINPGRSPVARGEEIIYSGSGAIRERLGDFVFRIAPSTFFQPNTRQAEQICRLVQTSAHLTGEETVFDLYCGSGAFSLFLSAGARQVVGIESHPEAVEDARQNAASNAIENTFFYAGDVRDLLGGAVSSRFGRPDVLITDPPRAGMHRDVCETILRLLPHRIVYVSCNPGTQARDLQILCEKYRIDRVQPVDMFPHTYHIENVVSLTRC